MSPLQQVAERARRDRRFARALKIAPSQTLETIRNLSSRDHLAITRAMQSGKPVPTGGDCGCNAGCKAGGGATDGTDCGCGGHSSPTGCGCNTPAVDFDISKDAVAGEVGSGSKPLHIVDSISPDLAQRESSYQAYNPWKSGGGPGIGGGLTPELPVSSFDPLWAGATSLFAIQPIPGRGTGYNNYDYAPSVMYGDGPKIKMWWLGQSEDLYFGDNVFYSELGSNGWSKPEAVLCPGNGVVTTVSDLDIATMLLPPVGQKRVCRPVDAPVFIEWGCGNGISGIEQANSYGSSWDSRLIGDPSVIKGNFTYKGESFQYAMYFDGTDRPILNDFVRITKCHPNDPDAAPPGENNQIGVAFSNDGRNWIKHDRPVIYPGRSAFPEFDGVRVVLPGYYGAGTPSAYVLDDGRILVAYTDTTSVPLANCTMNFIAESSDGIDFGDCSDPTWSKNGGCQPKGLATPTLLPGRLGKVARDGIGLSEIAYDRAHNSWLILTSHPDTEIHVFRTPNLRVGSCLPSGATTWDYVGGISSLSTGNTYNHNPGWLRWSNGDIYTEANTNYHFIFFGTGNHPVHADDQIAMSIWFDGWEFNDVNNFERWTAQNVDINPGPNQFGTWIFHTPATLDDPRIESPNIEVFAKLFPKVQFVMANGNKGQRTGRVYFRIGKLGYDPDQSVAFCVLDDPNQWALYTVDLEPALRATNNWEDYTVITGLRIDPVDHGADGFVGFDYIRLLPGSAPNTPRPC